MERAPRYLTAGALLLLVVPAFAQDVVPTRAERAQIAAFMRSKLNDPSSVREAQIGQFRDTPNRGPFTKMICMRFNAKNQFGGYGGVEDMILYYDAPGPSWTSPDKYEICSKFAAYRPFSELNGKR